MPDIPIQPVPSQYQVGVVKPNDPTQPSMVLLSMSDPTGTKHVFLDADGADRLAAALVQQAGVARTGIEIATRMPNGRPHA